MEQYSLLDKIIIQFKNTKENIRVKKNNFKSWFISYYSKITNIINSFIIISVAIAFFTTLTLNIHIAFYLLSASFLVYAIWLIRFTMYKK